MGEQDVIMRRLMQDKNVLADVINLLFFKGVPTVSAEGLEDVDRESCFLSKESPSEAEDKPRDALKRKSRGKTYFVLLGVESQSPREVAMTIRTLAYSQGDHRTERLVNGITKGSNAVFCAALYYGKSKWTSGASGKALIPRPEEPSMPEFLRHLSDYRIKVCDLSRMKLKQSMSFSSDLKAITAFLYLVRHKSRPKILDKVDCQNIPEVIRLLEAFNDIKLSESTIERVVDVAEGTIKMNDLAEAFITAQRDVGRKEESKEAKKRQTELLRKIALHLKERGFTSYDVHEVLHVVEFSVILKWFKEADAKGAEDQS